MGFWRGGSSVQTFGVPGLVIRRASLPAPEEDANPLEGETADRGLVTFPAGSLRIIVFARPGRARHRMLCPFLKGLFEELRTSPPCVDPLTPSTGFTYWRNSAVALNALRVREALALCSERGEKPRGKCFADPG